MKRNPGSMSEQVSYIFVEPVSPFVKILFNIGIMRPEPMESLSFEPGQEKEISLCSGPLAVLQGYFKLLDFF